MKIEKQNILKEKKQTQSMLGTRSRKSYNHKFKTILFTAHISVILNYALKILICNDIHEFKKCYSLQTGHLQHNCTVSHISHDSLNDMIQRPTFITSLTRKSLDS